MTVSVTIGGVDITDRIKVAEGFQSLTSAADGTAQSSGLLIDDPDGDYEPGVAEQVVVEEDECSRPRTYTGYVNEARPTRGPYRSGPSRVWVLDVGDLNVLLQLQAFHLADAHRTQETGTARRDWLLASSPGSYFVNNGFAPDFSGTFDEADYRGEKPDSVLTDISSAGRVFFLYWDDATNEVALYWAGPDDGFATSTLGISNDLADIDGVSVFTPDPASELTIDMSQVYDEIYVTGPFGSYFLSHHDTRLAPGIHRTGVFNLPRVGRMATAQAEAQILMDRYEFPIDSITCTLDLPASKVNLIDAGMIIPVKFTHLPGYQSVTNLRVARKTVNLFPTALRRYEVTLTLTNRGIDAISGGGGSGDFPHSGTCTGGTGDLVQSNTATGFTNNLTVALSSPASAGNMLVMGVSLRQQAFTADPTGWTTLAEGEVDPFENNSKLYYKTAAPGDQTWTWVPGGGSGDASAVIAEFAGGVSFVDSAELVSSDPYTGPSAPGASVTPTSGVVSTIVGFWGYKSDRVTDPTAGSGWTLTGTVKAGGLTRCAMVHKVVSSASGSYTPTLVAPDSQVVFDNHSYGEQSAAFSCDSTASPPTPGQLVPWTVVTMTGASGTTAFPYAAHTLEVKVDGVLISPASYTETDNTTGDFTLSWTPDTDEVVTVQYRGI